MTQFVYGKNVVKSLLADKKRIHEIIMLDNFKDVEIEKDLKDQRIPLRKTGRKQLDKIAEGGNHQGIIAKIDDYKIYEIDQILASIPKEKLPLLVLLDELEDPHNLGAILRTSDCVEVDGIIVGKHRSVSLTPTVAKVSTGAIDTVKVAMVTNLTQTLKYLKEQGYWIVGTDMRDSQDYRQAKYDMPIVLVIGSEGSGISPLVKKQCDFFVKLPMAGSVTSLNASVACGILLYQIYSQRHPL